MVKPNIREQAANKLNFFYLICELIIEGKSVSAESAKIARKDINDMIDWLDEKENKTFIKEDVTKKLNSFDIILERIIDSKTVSIEMATNGQINVKEIMAWLDKRKYKS